MQYTILKDGNTSALTVLHAGEHYFATSETHPNYNELVAKVVADDLSVLNDFSVEKTVAERFESLSERVSISGGTVYFDGDPVDDSLTEQIIRFYKEGVENWEPLVNFFEKVQQNPSAHSREQLFRWLAKHKFTLTHDGDIVGYKGVQSDLTSVHAGPAIVDGVAMNGHIPNNPGSEIKMARNSVQFDPSVGCATGLHVANWDYASSWSEKTLEVYVNPRDVVSVPTDSDDAKVRVCRYVVGDEVTEPYSGPVLEAAAEETDEDDDNFCEDCGDYLSDCRGLCGEEDDYCVACGGDCEYGDPLLDDEDDSETEAVSWSVGGSMISGPTTYGKYRVDGTSKVDTRFNYKSQQRDSNGRFVPKS